MKKLLALFTLLLLVTSCAKDVGISPNGDTSGDVVSLTASVADMTETKATLINSWSGGEQVALFVGDELYQYSIGEDGTMSGADIIIDREAELTYTSFYPYDETLMTIEEYEAACTAGHLDYMSATTTTTGTEVELQFSHLLAALSFTVLIESEVVDPAISLALYGDLSSAIALEVDTTVGWIASKLEANYFVEADTDISSAIIKIVQSGTTSLHSIAQEYSSTPEVGKQYQFYCTIGDITIDSELGISAGSGTIDDPFLIYTADALRNVGTGIVGWELSSHYKLCDNIDLESVEFTPIGSSDEMFTGSLDGDGYSITGLQITGAEAGQGLFKYTSGATIKNLKVGGTVTNSSGETAGLIIGYAKNNTTITDCETLSGSIVTNSGGNNTAGIVAYINSGATVTNCINRATVTGQKYSSGIAGYCSNSTTTFTNCTNEGDITNNSSSDYTAGILPRIFSNHTVKECSNKGIITSETNYIGGIGGSNEVGNVSYCYNTNSVTGKQRVGGIVGSIDEGSVSYCQNEGSVTGSSDYVGGIVGYNDCGTVFYSSNSGSVKGSERTGGIAGYSNGEGSSDWYDGFGAVGYCYNTGSITGTSSYTGGIVGFMDYGDIYSCYNTGSGSVEGVDYCGGIAGMNQRSCPIYDCYNTTPVKGTRYIGGVAGYNYNGWIERSYNTGDVEAPTNAQYVGGVCGRGRADASYDCEVFVYYDKEVVTKVTGARNSEDGNITTFYGLTTAEMQGAASTEGTMLYYFTNEDYGNSSEWTADDATNPINGGYPILIWQTSNN